MIILNEMLLKRKKNKSEPKVNPNPQIALIWPKHLHCSSKTLVKSQLSFVEN